MVAWYRWSWIPGVFAMLGIQVATVLLANGTCSAPGVPNDEGAADSSRIDTVAQLSPLAVMGWITGGLSVWSCFHWKRFERSDALHQWTLICFVALGLVGFWFCTVLLYRCSEDQSPVKNIAKNCIWFYIGCFSLERLAWLRCVVLRMDMLHQDMDLIVACCFFAFCITSAASFATLAMMTAGYLDFHRPGRAFAFAELAFAIPSITLPVYRLIRAARKAESEESTGQGSNSTLLQNPAAWLRTTAWCIAVSVAPTMLHAGWMQVLLWPEVGDAFPVEPEYLLVIANGIHLLDVATHCGMALVLAELSGATHTNSLSRLRAASKRIALAQEKHIQNMLAETKQAAASTVAALLGDLAPFEVMMVAKERFRCVLSDDLTYDIFASGGRNQSGPADKQLTHLSSLTQLGRCDAFISHSWYDEPEPKWEALMDWVEDFKQREGRSPRLWLDKLCIDQSNIEADLRCLPVFLASCQTMLVLAGSTYLSRLWCALELYVYVELHGNNAKIKRSSSQRSFGRNISRSMTRSISSRSARSSTGPEHSPISIVRLDESPGKVVRQSSSGAFDAAKCQCHRADDKARILEVITCQYPGGVSAFNSAVDQLLSEQQLVKKRPSNRSVASHTRPTMCSTPSGRSWAVENSASPTHAIFRQASPGGYSWAVDETGGPSSPAGPQCSPSARSWAVDVSTAPAPPVSPHPSGKAPKLQAKFHL